MKKKMRRKIRSALAAGAVPDELKREMVRLAAEVGALRTKVFLESLGEVTVVEMAIVNELLKQELDELRRKAGGVR